MSPTATQRVHHVAVWLDHHEARVFHIGEDRVDETTFHAPTHHVKRHPDRTAEKHHPDDAKKFFHEIAQALASADEVLVVGPSTAKLQFITHVHAHDPKLVPHIVGIETVDHPTDGQIVAYAKKYFLGADRLAGLKP